MPGTTYGGPSHVRSLKSTKEETIPLGTWQEWLPGTSALRVEEVTSGKVVQKPEIDVTRETRFSEENTQELIK